MRSHILRILVMKELRDLRKNMSALPLVLIAPLLSFLYSMLDIPGEAMFPFWVVYGIAMIGIMLPGMAIAEEKEKKTLDSLLVSPATPHEIIGGKVIFSLLMIIIVTILVVAPYAGLVPDYGVLIMMTILAATFFIQIGLIISLFCENQVTANAYMTPAMLVALIFPVLIGIFPEWLRLIMEYFPSLIVLKVLGSGIGTEGATALTFMESLWPYGVALILWNVVTYFFTMWGVRHQFD